MVGSLPYKTKQFFYLLIKLSIVVGTGYFIYNRLFKNEDLDFSVFYQFLIENELFSLKNFTFLMILSVFNWLLEILKWQKLVSFLTKISFYEATKQSLASHTASLISPNRIGEYVAKSAYYPKKLRKKILFMNLLGNMSQMAATCLFGLIGLFFLLSTYEIEVSLYRLARLVLIAALVMAFGFFAFYQDKLRIKGIPLVRIKLFVKTLPRQKLGQVPLLACFRYLVFSFQFFLLLQMFGIEPTYWRAMMVISSMYFLSSIIPSIHIFDVVIKGSVAVFLFELVGVNPLTTISIITLMWILNVVLPSIAGSFFVLSYKSLGRLKISMDE